MALTKIESSNTGFASGSAPTSPSAGDLWFDTGDDAMKVYNGTAWDTMSNAYSTEGGLKTTFGLYTVHTFLSSDTFVVTGSGTKTADMLCVGGGGAGGTTPVGAGGDGGDGVVIIKYTTS